MEQLDYYFNLIDKERNIYELADLKSQNRKEVSEYIDILQFPTSKKSVTESDILTFKENIANFLETKNNEKEWTELNKQFLNYHKSLSVYTLINSTPIINYTALHSGIGKLKNIKVADIGGGTGHTQCSFFQHPETIEYFLVDPNIRLLHDQFFRMYPKLSYLKMGHIVAKAEELPFKDSTFDLTMSLSAIDHMEDYKKFIEEAIRITKASGKIFISSHFDIPPAKEDATKAKTKLFSYSFWERVTRFLYYRKYNVQSDDHTFHFKNIEPIVKELKKHGVIIEKEHTFKRYFYVIAKKL